MPAVRFDAFADTGSNIDETEIPADPQSWAAKGVFVLTMIPAALMAIAEFGRKIYLFFKDRLFGHTSDVDREAEKLIRGYRKIERAENALVRIFGEEPSVNLPQIKKALERAAGTDSSLAQEAYQQIAMRTNHVSLTGQ